MIKDLESVKHSPDSYGAVCALGNVVTVQEFTVVLGCFMCFLPVHMALCFNRVT